jgi:hypothetical protein
MVNEDFHLEIERSTNHRVFEHTILSISHLIDDCSSHIFPCTNFCISNYKSLKSIQFGDYKFAHVVVTLIFVMGLISVSYVMK